MAGKWSWMAICMSLLACAGPSHEREETTSSLRTRPASKANSERQRYAAAAAKPVVHEDPLVQVSRQIEQEKQDGRAHSNPTTTELHDERAEKANKKVGVQGIHGTLSNFDVRVTMEQQSKAFAKCHEPRARKVPALAGGAEFNIRVLSTGEVSDVHVRQSDLGDRVLERCFSEVIRNTRFPAPHGGEATVQWTMSLAPARKYREPELWDSERIERVLKKNRGELLETCDATRVGAITVTAYVSKRGKVLAAGVAALDDKSGEHFDCIADELRSWPMPKPRRGIAKVSFALHS